MASNSVEMGWGAPPMKEQHPILPDVVCQQLDKDNDAICRLSLRGMLTQSQADAARKKYVAKVAAAIKHALTARREQADG
jgi:hypothetical protein